MAERGVTGQPAGAKQKVNVVIRARPMIQREKDAEGNVDWHIENHIIYQCQPGTALPVSATGPTYIYDHIFGQESKTSELYDKIVAPIVAKALDGFNGTVLCYGQTSSGKTYTMYGTPEEPGLIFLTADDLFRRMKANDASRTYLIKIGLLEVYNEKVTDLLDEKHKTIEMKEVKGEVIPKDLIELDIMSPNDILEAAKRVQMERKKGETQMNKESSRSHTIVRFLIQSVANDDSESGNDRQVTTALLNFVDLAGSERVDQTGASGERLREAGYINKSLTTLSRVVEQLSGTTITGQPNNGGYSSTLPNTGTQSSKQLSKQPFISYRDSKLTRLLQSSLSGNAYIALICNITLASSSTDETTSTLRFANSAKLIKIDPTKNLGPATASEYKNKISELEKQLKGKTTELNHLQKQLAFMQKFVKPLCHSPAPQQLERRRTLCPSMLGAVHRTLLLDDQLPADDLFKVPRSPRRSLMPSSLNTSHSSRVFADRSFELHASSNCQEEFEPPPKVTKVDAETWTEFSCLPVLNLPPRVPSPPQELEPSVRHGLNQSTIEDLHSEKSFVTHEKSIELEELTLKKDLLEAQVKELQADKERLQSENEFLQKKEAQVKELQADKERLQSENEFLQKNLTDAKTRNASIMGEVERLQDENINQVDFINEIREEIAELKTKLQESEEALIEAKKVGESNDDWKQKYEHLQAQMDKLREDSDSAHSTAKTLQAENEQMQAELETLKNQKDELQSELNKARDSISGTDNLRQQYDCLQAEMEKLYQEKQNSRAEYLKLEVEKEEVSIKCEKLIQMCADLESELESKNKSNESLQEQTASLQKQMETTQQEAQNKLEELSAHYASACTKLDDLGRENQSLQDVNDKLNGERSELINQLDNVKASIKDQEQLVGRLEDLSAENERLRSEFVVLQEKATTMENEMESSHKSNSELLAKVQSLVQELESAQRAATEAEKVKEELMQRVQSLQEELSSENERLCSEIVALQEKATALENEMESSHKSNSELQAKVQSLMQELESTQRAATEAEKIKGELTQRVQSLQSQSASTSASHLELQREHEKLSDKFETITMQLMTSEADKEELSNEVRIAQERISDLKSELRAREQKSDETLNILKTKLNENEKLLGELDSKLKERDAEITALKLQLAEREQKSDEALNFLKTKLNEKEKLLGELDSKLKERDGEITALYLQLTASEQRSTHLEAQVEQLRGHADVEVQNLQKLLEEARRAKDMESAQMNQKINELSSEVETLNDQFQRTEAELNELKELHASLKDERILWEEEKDALETKLKQASQDLEVCSQQLEQSQSDKEILEQELATLKSKLEALQCSESEAEQNHARNAELNAQIEALRTHNESQRDQLASSQARVQQLHLEIDSLTEQLHTQQERYVSELQKLEEERGKVVEECEKLKQERQSTIDRYEELQGEHQTTLKENEKLQHDNQDLCTQLENTSDKLATVELEFASVKSELEAMVIMRDSLEHQLEEMRVELEAAKGLADGAEELRANNAALLMEIEQLQRESDEQEEAKLLELRTKLDESERRIQTVVEELAAASKQAEDAVSTHEEELQLQKKATESLQVQLDSLKAELECTRHSGDTAGELDAQYQTQILQLQNNIMSLQTEKEVLQSAYDENQKSYAALQAELLSLQARADALQQSCDTADDVKQQNSLLTAELQQLKMEHETTRTELIASREKLQAECEALSSKLADLEAAYEASQAELAESRRLVEDLQRRVHLSQEELEARLKDSASTTEHLQQQHAELQDELSRLRVQHEELSEELTNLQNQRMASDSELEASKQALAEANEMCRKLEVHLETMKSEGSIAQQESARLASENKELVNQLEEVSQKVVTMELELRATHKSRESLNSQLEGLQSELEKKGASNEQLQSQHAELLLTLETIRSENDSIKAQIDSLTAEKESIRADYDGLLVAHDRITANYEALQVAQDSVKAECDSLKAEKQSLQAQLETAAQYTHSTSELKETNSALLAENQSLKDETRTQRAETDRLRQMNEEVSLKYEKAFSMLSQVESELDNAQKLKEKLLGQLEAANHALKEYAELKQQHEYLQTQLAYTETQREQQQQQYEKLLVEKQELDKALKAVQNQMQKDESRRQNEREETEMKLQKFQAQILAEKSGAEVLKKANEQLSDRCRKLVFDIEVLQKEQSSLKPTLEALAKEKVALEEKIQALESNREAVRPRVSLRSQACQTGNTVDVMDKLKAYKIHAHRNEILRENAEKESQKLQKELTAAQAHHAQAIQNVEELKQSVCAYAEEIERLKTLIKVPPESSSTEIQCSLAEEMFKRSKITKVDFPRGWPDFYRINQETLELKSELALSQAAIKNCTCGKGSSTKAYYAPQPARVPDNLRRTQSVRLPGILTTRPNPPNVEGTGRPSPLVSTLTKKFESAAAGTTPTMSSNIPRSRIESTAQLRSAKAEKTIEPQPAQPAPTNPRPDVVVVPPEAENRPPKRNIFQEPLLSIEELSKML